MIQQAYIGDINPSAKRVSREVASQRRGSVSSDGTRCEHDEEIVDDEL